MKKKSLLRIAFFTVLGSGIILLILLIIPFKREISYKISIDVAPIVAFNELAAPQNWKLWYFDSAVSKNDVAISNAKKPESIDYSVMNGDRVNAKGNFRIVPDLDGESVLQNNETVYFHSLTGKLASVFKPEEISNEYRIKAIQLKEWLEKPSLEYAGMHFVLSQMSPEIIVARKDTIPPGMREVQIINSYKDIRQHLNASILVNPDRPQSRFKVLDDGNIELQVGLAVKDPAYKVPPQFARLEVPACKLIIGKWKGKYEDLPEELDIVDDWIKRYKLKPATSPWIEHKMINNGSSSLLTDSLYIIQPIYYFPKKQ